MPRLSPLFSATLLLAAAAASATAQEAPRLRVQPAEGNALTFVIDRRTTVLRDPGRTYEEPRERKVVSNIRVVPRASDDPDHVLFEVTYLHVHGFESGDTLTEDINFDRKLDDPPSGRPETLVVGRTFEVEARRDGTFLAARGVDEAMPGNAVAASAIIADLRTLVTPLPNPDVTVWKTEALEGRALLRMQVRSDHVIRSTTDTETGITIKGKITAAPEGAGEAFANSFRVSRGERAATFRIDARDGLPLEGRILTAFAVEAWLSGSDMEVGVNSETVVAIHRTESPEDAIASPETERLAPTPGDSTPNAGLPGWIGTSRDIVRKLAGVPTRTGAGLAGGSFDTFSSFGLVYEYDDDEFVRRVTATQVAGGESFGGKILGVKLGDTLARVQELWGAATSRHEKPQDHDQVQFAYDSLLIELEIWREDGTDPAFGAYRADTVKRIRVTNRKGR